MDHPTKPETEDCCNSGCNPCIFDVYEQQLKSYQKYLEKEAKDEPLENAISELVCTQFRVTKARIVCDGHKIITLKCNQLDNKAVWWKAGQHFIIKYVNADLKCSRAYTPIKLKNKLQEQYDFAIVVKKYENGVMSNYLFNLKEGDITLWRGPYGPYELQPNKYNRIVMLAQGTGIAPFISIIDEILNNEDDMTRIILLVCYSGNALLFREDLYSYKAYWNFGYTIFLSGMSKIAPMYKEPIEYRKLSPNDIAILEHLDNDNYLICGSKEFSKFYGDYLKEVGVLRESIFQF